MAANEPSEIPDRSPAVDPSPQSEPVSPKPGADDRDRLPPLNRDPSYWGAVGTQFLGAFNDNVFKQLILLLSLTLPVAGAVSEGAGGSEGVASGAEAGAVAEAGTDVGPTSDESRDLQGRAAFLFALPFVLISGFAGFLSDRYSKRTIFVYCKVAEILVMVLGLFAFLSGDLTILFAVLFLMGTQSAFFGPAKYGILPEMFRDSDLPRANGMVNMTTFLSIIFGTLVAGGLMTLLDGAEDLWIASFFCIFIAGAGTGTALLLRSTPIAQPGLEFSLSTLVGESDTWAMLRRDPPLLLAVFIYSLFWGIAGICQLAVNALGIKHFGLNEFFTSAMLAVLSIGIAVGFVLAGRLSKGKVELRLVRAGAWGLTAVFVAISLAGFTRDFGGNTSPDTFFEFAAYFEMLALGIFTGFFALPLMVYIQVRPPRQFKGRVIGIMNIVNWVCILLGAALYDFVAEGVFPEFDAPASAMFAVVAVMMLPIALFYRPSNPEMVAAGSGSPSTP